MKVIHILYLLQNQTSHINKNFNKWFYDILESLNEIDHVTYTNRVFPNKENSLAKSNLYFSFKSRITKAPK